MPLSMRCMLHYDEELNSGKLKTDTVNEMCIGVYALKKIQNANVWKHNHLFENIRHESPMKNVWKRVDIRQLRPNFKNRSPVV